MRAPGTCHLSALWQRIPTARSATRAWGGLAVAGMLVVGGCASPAPVPGNGSDAPSAPAPASPPDSSPAPSATSSPTPPARPFDADAAFGTVERLAAGGPREATGPAYAEAAEEVQTEFERRGYRVSRQEFDVPAGTSWGVAVPAGRTWNVIADPPGFDTARPHVVIGAHLDTVPQSPGAEDNASGVAVLLELARMTAEQPAVLPVRFIAFGAEEPRGSGDSRHHYGSQHYVGGLEEVNRQAIVGMVSLDRVGVRADAVPVCHGGRGTPAVRDALTAASPDIATRRCENTSSDHWSFEKAGIPAARVGSTPFAGYHSPRDVPTVIDPGQLTRVGTVVWNWLRAQPA